MTKKLDKKIKKLLKSISKLQKKRKVKKGKRKARKSKKNIQAEFATQQLLTQLRNASASGGSGAVVANDAKRKIEEIQEEGRRSDKEKLKKSIEALEHKANENTRGLTGLQQFALQFQQQQSQQQHAPRGFAWTIDEEDEPESKAAVTEMKKLQHKQQELDNLLEDGGKDVDVENIIEEKKKVEHEITNLYAERTKKMLATKAKKKAEKEEANKKALEEAEAKKKYDAEMNMWALIEAQNKAEAAKLAKESQEQEILDRTARKLSRQNKKQLQLVPDSYDDGYSDAEPSAVKPVLSSTVPPPMLQVISPVAALPAAAAKGKKDANKKKGKKQDSDD